METVGAFIMGGITGLVLGLIIGMLIFDKEDEE
jgi:hypothetical protein